MLTCREATLLISESLDRDLPFRQRVALRGHVFRCKFCSRYRKQLRFVRDLMMQYSKREEGVLFPDLSLSAESRERMKILLNQQEQSS